MSQPDKSGFMKKQGGRGLIKNFERRWFELRARNLKYFKEKGSGEKGQIDLTNTKVELDPKHKLQFTLSGSKLSRTYLFECQSEQEKNDWVAALQKSISGGGAAAPAAPARGGVPQKEVAGSAKQEAEIMAAEAGQEQAIVGKKVGLDDFDLITVIGCGSFGKVFKVKKKDDGRVWAMKVLKKAVVQKEDMVQHTKAEKNILQAIDHPFIVQLAYAFQTKDKLYLILEFLGGGELFFHLRNEGTFSEDKARFYTSQIGMALEHLHDLDIVYRDLKPENIVLDMKGNANLTDFGLAKTNQNKKATYTFCGTPEYLAPEILNGTGHSKAVDWWSLGILCYEMMAGLPPFFNDNIDTMYEQIMHQELTFPDDMSQSAQDLLAKLLDRDPAKRLTHGPTFRKHPWFAPTDFKALYEGRITPPFVPEAKGDYFDEEFTSAPLNSVAPEGGLGGNEGQHFDNFTFVAPGRKGGL